MNEQPPPNDPELKPDVPDGADDHGQEPHGPEPEQGGAPEDQVESVDVVFSRRQFDRELSIDAVLRHGLVVLAVIAILVLMLFGQAGSMAGLAVVILVVFGWVAVSTISANIWRALPAVTVMIGRDPSAAEAGLSQLMRHRPLVRWVRLMLYHRLAAIRHRQHRFSESAAICRAVLSQPLGPASRQRGSLLLMLAEASLQCRDPHGAYAALAELHGIKLGLAEHLQRLTIQTRYEVLTGHDRAALAGIHKKLLMAELMPAEHCGAMHAMLTASAKRAGKDELADWLWRRSELLCGREKLDRLVRGAFAIGRRRAAGSVSEKGYRV